MTSFAYSTASFPVLHLLDTAVSPTREPLPLLCTASDEYETWEQGYTVHLTIYGVAGIDALQPLA